MKKRVLLVTILCFAALLFGCHVPQIEPTPKPTRIPSPTDVEETEEEIQDEPADVLVFGSMDEFNLYLATESSTKDLASLATLERYYVPTDLPEGYVLYKITAGIVDIGFWYMPRDYLSSRDGVFEGESQQKHFLFVSGRGKNSLAAIMEKDGASSKYLIDGRYYEPPQAPGMIYWEEDGELLYMYLPAGSRKSDLSALCATECYVRSEDGTFVPAP